jgi:DNA-binding NarL/FixJ family response regulator
MSYPDEWNHPTIEPSPGVVSVGSRASGLTPRQYEFLVLMTDGRNMADAAAEAYVTVSTFKNTLCAAYNTLGVSGLVAAYARLGWIVVR